MIEAATLIDNNNNNNNNTSTCSIIIDEIYLFNIIKELMTKPTHRSTKVTSLIKNYIYYSSTHN